ncbi:hypothetical protein Goklo_018431 [Gossypium klotzschianum]|uniref:CASP-like protein n=1 Tax=Gossypium klotzschianum TaxID=34286 RepID=A0A7J8UKT2_9ROSI|nr:hypothetical protein [Gossypium klotzschianum]
MKVFIGSPGTVSGLMLRIYQCAFAAASIAVMVSASDFSSYTAFCSIYSWERGEMFRFDGVERMVKVEKKCTAMIVILCSFDILYVLCFSYLTASMGLQLLWSFGLACLDVYALRRKRDLQNPVLVSLFVVGYSYVITGSCMFVGRGYSPVCKRLGLLQGSNSSPMQSI